MEKELRTILDCTCAYNDKFDGKSWNNKTQKYEDCGCLTKMPEILQLISNREREAVVNRFEVIDHTPTAKELGRALVKWHSEPFKVEFSYQDDGRILKVFLTALQRDSDD